MTSIVGTGIQQSRQMPCLVCGQMQPKNSFLAHVAEHLNYCQHKCQDCPFQSITVEEMADHESANPDHIGQLYALRNQYLDRVCRFIYNDCDFGERNGGGLARVLKRKFAGEEEIGGGGQQSNMPKPMSSTGGGLVKAEDCALPSPKVVVPIECRMLEQLQPAAFEHHQWTGILEGQQQQSSSGFVMTTYQQMGPHHVGFVPADANNYLEQQPTADIDTQQDMGSTVLEKLFSQQHASSQQVFDEQKVLTANSEIQQIEGDESFDGEEGPSHKKAKKKPKETFESVQCLKCGQWVKGRGICLLYHMNTRHLKLPMYRCRACPRDFFYVTDTTAKNHIRSFHANDLSLLENNYNSLSKILHKSRKEFYGESKSEKRAATSKKALKSAGDGAKRMQQRNKAQPKAKKIAFRERPQAGSGVAGNSSHVQCNQCGEFVATIYSSQLSHMNTKHLHLAIYECRLCQRAFESLSSSAAVMHVKSIHGKEREEAESGIVDRRDECLKQLNESYRAFFA